MIVWLKKINQALLINIIIIFFISIMLWQSKQYTQTSRMFPQIVAIGILILSFVDLTSNLMKSRKENKEGAATEETNLEEEAYKFKRWSLTVLALIMFLALTYLIGFLYASIIFIPIFSWVLGLKKLWTIALATGLTATFLYIIFIWFLKVPLMRGVIF